MDALRCKFFGLYALIVSAVILCPLSSKAQLYRAMKNEDQLTVDFEFQGELIIVDLFLGGLLPMKFIYDTGAEYNLLFDKYYADILGLTYDRKIPVFGSSLDTSVYALVARNVPFQISGLPLVQSDMLVLEQKPQAITNALGIEVHGLLGANFFGGLPFQINYQKEKITFYHPKTWAKASKSSYQLCDLIMINQKPYCNIVYSTDESNNKSYLFLIDSGASLGVLVHQNTSQNLEVPSEAVEGVLGYGISGYLTGFLSRLQEFSFGPYKFRNEIIAFQKLDTIHLDSLGIPRNGIIGNTFLKKFNIVFDYSSSSMYIQKNKYFSNEAKYDKSGLVIGAFGAKLHQYVVLRVLDGSPAQKAGIKRGDIVKRIGWLPAFFWSLEGVINKFKGREHKKIPLKIKRGDQKIKTRITLRELP